MDDGRPYYGRARIAGGLLLLTVAAVLMIVDALSDKYVVPDIQLGLVLGTGSVLLGVEAIGRYIGRG
jgi:hypothetical protein